MTDAEALDRAIAETGHARFRELLDPAHPDHDPRYWTTVRQIATGEAAPRPAPRPPAGPSPTPSANPGTAELAVLAIVAECPHARVCNCQDRGKVECQPGGKRPGQKLAPAECRACLDATYAALPQVAIVVPCHNYGRFLAEALESALVQTRPPSEVLVVDDSSTDDTAEVAASFARRGVRYLRGEWRDVHRAREAGYLATSSAVLCFLDADDVLPRDYLAAGLPLLAGPGVGIVYSDVQHFGDSQWRSNYPAFDRRELERDNFLHAGSLVRREALRIADAFAGPSPVQAFADWHLWRRVADAGFTGAKSPALYRYRRHGQAMLARPSKLPYHRRASLELADVTIFTPLSGRESPWRPYTDWLLRQSWPRDRSRLVLCDTSRREEFGGKVRYWMATKSGYPAASYYAMEVGAPGLADADRRIETIAVRTACKRIYNRMARELTTPFVFVVEDDVIPPADVVARLMRGMEPDVAAVAAPYRSRLAPAEYVCWDAVHRPHLNGTGLADVGGSGFGCTLLRRAVLEGETFASGPGQSDDYDVAFSQRVRAAGWRWRVDWDTRAEHLGAS